MNTKLRLCLILLAAMSIEAGTSAYAVDRNPASPDADTAENTAKIDLNRATEQQLMTLPGVGEVTARKIISGRPYSSLQDLTQAGVPQHTLNEISPLITVSRAHSLAGTASHRRETSARNRESGNTASINLNTASSEQLQSLNGIGSVYADRIIANRPYKSVSDLTKAGIPKATIDRISPQVTASSTVSPEGYDSRHRHNDQTAPAPRRIPPATQSSPDSNTPPIGSGQVWLNTKTHVYHKEGDPWYGKTESGKFMTEEEAIQDGGRLAK